MLAHEDLHLAGDCPEGRTRDIKLRYVSCGKERQ